MLRHHECEPPISCSRNILRFDAGTLLDTEALSSQALQESVGKFGKVFTWEVKQMILGLRKECWAPIVISGENKTQDRLTESEVSRFTPINTIVVEE